MKSAGMIIRNFISLGNNILHFCMKKQQEVLGPSGIAYLVRVRERDEELELDDCCREREPEPVEGETEVERGLYVLFDAGGTRDVEMLFPDEVFFLVISSCDGDEVFRDEFLCDRVICEEPVRPCELDGVETLVLDRFPELDLLLLLTEVPVSFDDEELQPLYVADELEVLLRLLQEPELLVDEERVAFDLDRVEVELLFMALDCVVLLLV